MVLICVAVQLILVCRCTFIIIINNIAKRHNIMLTSRCVPAGSLSEAHSPRQAPSRSTPEIKAGYRCVPRDYLERGGDARRADAGHV